MYQDYWGLRELPFENTPDPKFFYSSEEHKEALSRLQYLVSERKACGVLTGVYGCGKTLVMRALINATQSQGNRYSAVTNPRLDDLGLLRMILSGFTKHDVPAGKADTLMALQNHIEGVAHDGKHSVIVIDEAHAILGEDVFEELRLLMNLQTDTRSLITLLLVGQPELKPRIETNKQLNQRVSLRYHLDAFSAEESAAYVRHRLAVAGAKGEEPFTPAALAHLHKHSGGIPRWINQYANMSLLNGYGMQARQITPEMVEDAVQSVAGSV